MISAKDFNSDIISSNKTYGVLVKYTSDYISDSIKNSLTPRLRDNLFVGSLVDMSDESAAYGKLVDYKLFLTDCGSNKCLNISGKVTDAAKDKNNQIKVDIKILGDLIQEANKYKNDISANYTQEELLQLQNVIDSLNEEKTKLSSLSVSSANDSSYIDIVAPNITVAEKQAVLALRDEAVINTLGALGADLASREGIKLALQIKENADNIGAEALQTNSSTNAVNSTMNIASDSSISARIAMAKNPFSSYAKRISKLRFASNSSLSSSYINDYTNGLWFNAFGGANIINKNTGSLYGANLGIDKQVSDDFLLGFYLSYAKADLKDTLSQQESNNYQLGLYSNVGYFNGLESNFKAFAQFSNIDKTISSQIDGVYTSTYTTSFLSAYANIGKVFELSKDSFFIKPFIGLNYYYSHTPAHQEIGLLSKDIQAIDSSALSGEFGLELRTYFSENSYFFAVPKFEQYLLNSSDDYQANISINNAVFTRVAVSDKKKSYTQLSLGGNLDLSKALSLNLGLAAKQILAGKADNKDETYLTGQLGFRYKF